MKFAALILFTATSCALAGTGAFAQDPIAPTDNRSSQLTETGKTSVDGQTASYLIRRLPASSFPDLPDAIADVLDQRGCMIPQTYQAHRPENVIHASFERPGSSDWAVLCSTHGNVDLLVFFARTPRQADVARIGAGTGAAAAPRFLRSAGLRLGHRSSFAAARPRGAGGVGAPSRLCSTMTRSKTAC